MQETQAAAAALETVPGPDTRTLVRLDWTPETLQREIDREKGMRDVLQRYMKEAMIPEHHYYSFKEGDKPALTQEGAHNLSSLFKTIIGPPELHETFHEDGHYTVRSTVHIFNQAGDRIATGDGICSTRESKYAYRWGKENELPAGFDASTAKTRGGTNRNGGSWKQYQIPNQDLPDLYNTVLKMSVKRAKVAGVRQLPLVSELFAPDDPGDGNDTKSNQASAAAGRKGEQAHATQAPPQTPPSKETAVSRAVDLAAKLIDRGVASLDLERQFLPEGVTDFAHLSEEQAAEAMPAMVDLLNAKLKGH